MNRYLRNIIIVFLITVCTHALAVTYLPQDFDEPVYVEVAMDYARFLRSGDFNSGYFNPSPAAKAVKAAAPASLATLVANAVAWARAYTESPGFKAEYEQQRQAARPSPPEAKGTVDEELARQAAERRKSLEEMKRNVSQMPPDMRKSMEAAVKEAEANNAKLEKDPQMVAMMRQGIEAQRAEEQQAYKGRLAAYEQRWPADSRRLVARRLQEFLDISKDIDFGAKLVPGGRLMRLTPSSDASPTSSTPNTFPYRRIFHLLSP